MGRSYTADMRRLRERNAELERRHMQAAEMLRGCVGDAANDARRLLELSAPQEGGEDG